MQERAGLDREEIYVKKIKNFVIGGIENKIFNLVLVTTILIVAVYTFVIYHQSNRLSTLVSETNDKQKQSIMEISDGTMESVVNAYLVNDTQLKANVAEEVFQDMKSNVTMLGDYAGALFEHPENVTPGEAARPDPSMDGKTSVQLLSDAGVDLSDPDISGRVGLIANMSDMMRSMFDNTQLDSCFIGLPEGVFLIAEDRAGAKFDENGEIKTIPVTQRPWYTGAAETGKLYFTDVEVDAFNGSIGIVCSVPVYQDGKLVAVVGADLFLNSLQEYVEASDEYGGFVCIVNEQGHVIFSPRKEGTFQVRLSSEGKDLRESDNTDLASFVKDSMQKPTDVRLIEEDGSLYYMSGAPLPTIGWTVITAASYERVMSPTVMMEEKYDSILDEAVRTYDEENAGARRTILILLLVVFILSTASALILSKRIVKPLNTISKNVERLSVSHDQFRMEDVYRTGDEIEVLAEKFASLSSRAVHYVDQIKRVTAEKERINSELEMANAIQVSQLPHLFPAFPDRKEFDIYASMTPAKEVGGDFYDFFLVDNDHIALVMADVSGKGVPAALFMMVSKLLIRSRVQSGESPGLALRNVNNQLIEGNEIEFFVTVWLAVIEISTGKGVEVNAGHEHPVLRRSDGDFELIKYRHSLAVAAMEDISFREREFQLYPGDTVFVYTDGVAEAANSRNELYGTERMLSILNSKPCDNPEQVLRNVMHGINDFVDGAEQFDDITMLCFRYSGPDKTEEISDHVEAVETVDAVEVVSGKISSTDETLSGKGSTDTES